MITRSDDLNEEQRQQNREMDVESLAKVVFRHLKENLDLDPDPDDPDYSSVERLIRDLFPEEDYPPPSNYPKLLEAITLLERRGLVIRSVTLSSRGTNQFDFFVYFTSVGMKSDIEDEILLLVDKPEETVRALEDSVESLDDIVRQYYLESLRAYQEGLYISSVICLGAASERAVHWLAESIGSYSEKYQEKIKAKRYISDLTGYLSGVTPNIFGDDKKFVRELKELLDELGQLYRKNRNDAGHPETVEQTSWLGEGQAARLDLFRRYIVTICEAIKRLEKQSTS